MDKDEFDARAALLERMAKAGLVKMVAVDSPEEMEKARAELESQGLNNIHIVDSPEAFAEELRRATDSFMNGSTMDGIADELARADTPEALVRGMGKLWMAQMIEGNIEGVLESIQTYSRLIAVAQTILAANAGDITVPRMDSKEWPHHVVLVTIRPVNEDVAGIQVSYLLRGRCENVPEVIGNLATLEEILIHSAKMSVFLYGTLTTQVIGPDKDELTTYYDGEVMRVLKGMKNMPTALGDRTLGGFKGTTKEGEEDFLEEEPPIRPMPKELEDYAKTVLTPEEMDLLRRTEEDDNLSN